jgi:hypothetical protein
MLDPTTNVTSISQPHAPAGPRVVFKMTTSDRMAGSVPAWVQATDPKDQTVAALAATSRKAKFADDLTHAQNETAMAYGPQQAESAANDENADEPFGFGDLVDIVNPLQHIPIVSNLYRAVTGDHIRPSSDIIGGAIYGGLAGAAGGLANVIIKHETGKNVMEHAVAMIEGDDKSTSAPAPAKSVNDILTGVSAGNAGKSLERLASAENNELQDLPGSALSFVDLASRTVKPLAAKPERYTAMYHFNT